MPLNNDEIRLLNRLLARAHPTRLQRELIASLQRKLGIREGPGPGETRFREIVDRQRIANARLAVLGIAGATEFRFHYTRIIEIIPRRGLGRSRDTATLTNGEIGGSRLGRYHVIRVDSPVPLVGVGIEEAFRLQLRTFRRLVRYDGFMRFVSPMEAGVATPQWYAPFIGGLLIERLAFLLGISPDNFDYFAPPED
jgi:hypothetical protein